MTSLSKAILSPVDFTFIVGDRAFEKWKLTLRDSISKSSISVVGDRLKEDFAGGHLTQEAVDRMYDEVIDYLDTESPCESYEIDEERVKWMIKRF